MPSISTTFLLALVWTTVGLAGSASEILWTRIEPTFGPRIKWLTRSTARIVLIPFVLSLVTSAAMTLIDGPPLPRIHDEQSRLLQASTFRELRLTNPPHPMAEHFETYHVLHSPTYASKYPPADAMFFAAGWGLAGRPYVGAWLAIALACAAISWMAAAWLPNGWALIAGALVALHPTVMNWSNSYFGGGAAMLGGALVVGAARRVFDAPSRRDAMLGAVGVVLLANSRPYEGLVLTLETFVILSIVLIFSSRNRLTGSLGALLVPLLAILVLAGSWMAWYNFRVTGDPMRLPYSLYSSQYSRVQVFPWQPLNFEARYVLPKEMARHQDWEERTWRSQQSLSVYLRATRLKSLYYLQVAFNAQESHRVAWEPSRRDSSSFHSIAARAFPLALAFPLVALPWLLRRDRDGRLLLAGCAVFFVFLNLPIFANSHYAAPGAGIAILLVICCLRALALSSRRWLRSLAWMVAIIWIANLSGFLQSRVDDRFDGQAALHNDITRHLESIPGRDLVIVRYQPDHDVHIEHVYNDANIDESEIVWARDLDSERNRELRKYFAGREAWVLDPDATPPRLERLRPLERGRE